MPERQFLLGTKYENEWSWKVVSPDKVIHFIDMLDCDPDIQGYQFFELLNTGAIQQIYYRGWQPGCYIELVDDNGETVLDGYGTDH